MAFGFGFNKQKALSSAEKFVQQGKLQNAIAEYEKVLKADPKDLTVSNTVGDLYSRLGQADKAATCFKSVGDAYAAQGFTVKAIAMYKKLTKLKPSLEHVLRLAELYTQQGLFNDARAQYLLVAEEFLRSGQLEEAVRIFQKTLEMDPENVAMRMRLAEVYIRLNKKNEAWQIFTTAADNLRAKGQLAAAEEILQRMLKLDPHNSYALLMRGRTAFETGNIADAIKNLEGVADLDSHPEGLKALMQAYQQSGRLAEAGSLATKISTVHNDVSALASYSEALMAGGQSQEVLRVYQENFDRLLANDSGKVLDTLHALIGHVRDSVSALETLVELTQKAGDKSHLSEIYELLAHAAVQSGSLEKARDYYLKLTQLEPQNQMHTRNYEQVLARLGGKASSPNLITAEEGAVLVDELEATAPFLDQRYPDEVALAVRAALTDAELFISYNMPAKALGPLMAALPKAPKDLRVNQRLAALHTRASRFAEAAVCCRTLQQLYHDAGNADEATRYGELAQKYETRSGANGAEQAAQVPPQPVLAKVAATAVEATAAPFFHAPEAASQIEAAQHAEPVTSDEEVDISGEWESDFSIEAPASGQHSAAMASGPSPSEQARKSQEVVEAVEEIRFYLSQGMVNQARSVFARLEKLNPGDTQLSILRREIEAAAAQAAPEASVKETHFAAAPESDFAPAETQGSVLKDLVSDLDASLGNGFASGFAAPPAIPEVAVAQAKHNPHDNALGDFVSGLEESLGPDYMAEAPPAAKKKDGPRSPQPAPAPPLAAPSWPAPVVAASDGSAAAVAPARIAEAPQTSPSFTYGPSKPRPLAGPASLQAATSPGVDLADMFGELKQELEEDAAAAQEDPETHYNLGVAFREMGLLDEAISELQKVCQSVDRGHPFAHLMQTYTWLAQCFLDKGVPEAAIRWYEKALKIPQIDGETITALNYELAAAYETAGNRPAALTHFMHVYGSNIDYRDVAERIQALKS
jgi:pilus assembly protein FimV